MVHTPDYYHDALKQQIEAQRQRRRLISQGQAEEVRLRRERSPQLYQVEYLSFLLAVLLESPSCLEPLFTHKQSIKAKSTSEQSSPEEVMPME